VHLDARYQGSGRPCHPAIDRVGIIFINDDKDAFDSRWEWRQSPSIVR
jgi:hypothetical protein